MLRLRVLPFQQHPTLDPRRLVIIPTRGCRSSHLRSNKYHHCVIVHRHRNHHILALEGAARPTPLSPVSTIHKTLLRSPLRMQPCRSYPTHNHTSTSNPTNCDTMPLATTLMRCKPLAYACADEMRLHTSNAWKSRFKARAPTTPRLEYHDCVKLPIEWA